MLIKFSKSPNYPGRKSTSGGGTQHRVRGEGRALFDCTQSRGFHQLSLPTGPDRKFTHLIRFLCCFYSSVLQILASLCFFPTLVFAQAPTSEFDKELEIGKQAAAQSNYAEAAKHFNKANELREEKCSECYVWLARINMGVGNLQQALKETEQAVSTAAPGSELAHAELYQAIVLARQGNLTPAEAALRAGLVANPTCVECRFNLGFVLLKEAKDDEGIAILKTVAPEFVGTPRGSEIQRLISDPSRLRKNYAPEFSAKLSTGKEVNLDTLKGKVVLLDFWGTWCEPCRVSLPLLKDLAAKVDPTKVEIISIDEYDAKPAWQKFVQANGMNWGQVYDNDLSLHNAFQVDGFPRYYILSKDGIILAEFKGWKQDGEATIANAIAWALKQ